jgi:hypothetical protein
MRVFFIALLLTILPSLLLAQSEERLFCAECGKQNEITFTFCFNCGTRLDTSVLIARLKARVAAADSSNQQVVFAPAELKALVQAEAEAQAHELVRRSAKLTPTRLKTDVEKTLDVVVPILVGTTALYFIGQALYR